MSTVEVEETKFAFDEEFQRQIAALALRDTTFLERCDGLLSPAYFQNECEAILVKLTLEHFAAYRMAPSRASLAVILKNAKATKLVTDAMWPDLLQVVKDLHTTDIADRDFCIDQTASFAKHQAMESAILASAGMLDKADFPNIEKTLKAAMEIGSGIEDVSYNFFDEIDSRTAVRKDTIAGLIKPDGITTGFKEIDNCLYNKGWGRKELTVLMGPAKSGKSFALIAFAVKACLAGFNVLYVTLEVSKRIVSERMDANISGVSMNDLVNHMAIVKDRVHKAQATGVGKFDVREYPSGTLKPSELRRLVKSHRARGIVWDLIVCDYADLMAPDIHSKEPRENSRQIYVGLRQIASEENCAMLSATQTNREGFKVAVGKMEHVAEDINKARTVDLLISINATDTEKTNGETRFYFAASRNQKSGMTVKTKGDLNCARLINEVVDIT